jgi:murein L,D-transpeptidase YafK
MKRFPHKIIFISFAFISILSGVYIFVAAQKEKPRSLSEVKNPQLVVRKKERLLRVYDEGELIKTYNVALGRAPRGDKEIEGDGKTPEGEFYVFTKNDKSRFYLSLGLSYPNREAATRGLQEKLITQEEHEEILKAIAEKRMPPQKTALGGEIYIHGGGAAKDWTEGCVALPDEEIKELFAAIPVGAPVTIEP